jgi:hypothetical protein
VARAECHRGLYVLVYNFRFDTGGRVSGWDDVFTSIHIEIELIARYQIGPEEITRDIPLGDESKNWMIAGLFTGAETPGIFCGQDHP